MQERRLIRWVCWLAVASTSFAIAVVYVVENKRVSRNLARVPQMSLDLEEVMAYKNESMPTVKQRFQAYSIGAPSCTPISDKDVSFTLVTQCSDSRLWMLDHHCQRWKGPISISIYTNRTQEQVENYIQKMNCNNELVTFEIYPATTMVDYPINVLRNVAFSNVRTSHAFYIDMDFWPSENIVQSLYKHQTYLATDQRRALVVPAFSLKRQCADRHDCRDVNVPAMPLRQEEVFDEMISRKIFPFDPTNRGGHGSTRYKEWIRQSLDELIEIPCFSSQRYEPYVVVRYCQDLPPFQEGFSGYGKNKVSWVMHLRRAGWTFAQVGKAFVVHYPHLDSAARQAWNGRTEGSEKKPSGMIRRPANDEVLLQTRRSLSDQLFFQFKEWLDEQYRRDKMTNPWIRTPLCDDSMDDDSSLWVTRPRKHPQPDRNGV
jgi:hypothetical protein